MAKHIINGTLVVTQHEFPPIPVRDFDWLAVTDNYDGPGSLIGHGATEQEAIDDLLEQMPDAEPFPAGHHFGG